MPPNFGPLPVPPGVLLVITTPEQGRAIVNTLASAKVDAIKVRNALTTETYMAIAQEAKRWGIPFDGHLPPDVNIVQASDAGQRVVEHLQGLAALCAANPAALNQGRGQGAGPAQGPAPPPQPIEINRARCEETARHLIRNGTWLTPTIGAPVPGNNPVRQFNLQITQIAAQAGVPMLAGTDWPGILFSNGQRSVHQELAGLVEAGLTPQQALRTATVNPARLFNMNEQLGSIEQGNWPISSCWTVIRSWTSPTPRRLPGRRQRQADRLPPRQKMLADFEAVLKEAAATGRRRRPQRRRRADARQHSNAFRQRKGTWSEDGWSRRQSWWCVARTRLLPRSGGSLPAEKDLFSANFPGEPVVTEYRVGNGIRRHLPARVYTVKQGPSTYSVTVVDYNLRSKTYSRRKRRSARRVLNAAMD